MGAGGLAPLASSVFAGCSSTPWAATMPSRRNCSTGCTPRQTRTFSWPRSTWSQDPQGRFLSYAVWTQSIESLLPQSDLVVFGGMDGEPTMVPWCKMTEEVGHLLEPLDMYPPRYCVREFPSAEQWPPWEMSFKL